MFRCESCNRLSERGEPAARKVTATREVTYKPRPKANRNGADDPGGKGRETVREMLVCLRCSMSKQEQLKLTQKLLERCAA